MPAGRLAVFGGFARVSELPYSVNVCSLKRWVKRGTPPPPLSVLELREKRRDLRKLVRIYRIARATPQPTATERRIFLKAIKMAARRFIEVSSKLSAEALIESLARSDVNTNRLLYIDLLSRGHSSTAVIAMKKQIRDLFSSSIYPTETRSASAAFSQADCDRIVDFILRGAPVVQALAEINVVDLVPGSGRWPDPALAHLVAGIEPIWHRVTGRTAGLISKDRSGDVKECPFADWLVELLERAKIRPPPVGRIVDIVRPRRRKKSATRHGSGLGE